MFSVFQCFVLVCSVIFRCNFIVGRPKAALLFWFFGDFRCGALLFLVILVIYKDRKIVAKCQTSR